MGLPSALRRQPFSQRPVASTSGACGPGFSCPSAAWPPGGRTRDRLSDHAPSHPWNFNDLQGMVIPHPKSWEFGVVSLCEGFFTGLPLRETRASSSGGTFLPSTGICGWRTGRA